MPSTDIPINYNTIETGIQQSAKLAESEEREYFTLKTKQNAVDDAFASLFGDNFNKPSEKSNKKTDKKSIPNHMKKTKMSSKRKFDMINEIFGGTWIGTCPEERKQWNHCNRSTLHTKSKKSEGISTIHSEAIIIKKNNDNPIDSTSSNESLKKKHIYISDSMIRRTGKEKASGIDYILSQIRGPTKINTITKTSHDWDHFKERNSLDEELKQNSEGRYAYLLKKEFLEKVDLRRYELEKQNRENIRAIANNN